MDLTVIVLIVHNDYATAIARVSAETRGNPKLLVSMNFNDFYNPYSLAPP